MRIGTLIASQKPASEDGWKKLGCPLDKNSRPTRNGLPKTVIIHEEQEQAEELPLGLGPLRRGLGLRAWIRNGAERTQSETLAWFGCGAQRSRRVWTARAQRRFPFGSSQRRWGGHRIEAKDRAIGTGALGRMHGHKQRRRERDKREYDMTDL